MKWLDRIWYESGHWILKWILIPFSWLYQTIVFLRSLAYRYGWFTRTHFHCPIIVVGNITVGGTGKTPLVIWLAEFLKEAGYHPGIISRGYQSTAPHYPYAVEITSDAKQVGDEALLLKQKTNCPVVIDPHRTRGVTYLLEKYSCDLIISDDGLQHHALGRTIEIAVIDGQRKLGNGYCLPAGPLRETPARLGRVNFIICNGDTYPNAYSMHMIPHQPYPLMRSQDAPSWEQIKGSKEQTLLLTAIGNPERFFQTAALLGFHGKQKALRDHAFFSMKDFDAEVSLILITEKDAVKCQHFTDPRIWCLPIKAELPAAFSAALLNALALKKSHKRFERHHHPV